MDSEQVLHLFIDASRELLADMEIALIRVRRAADDGESIDALFQAVHALNGAAGIFGLDYVVAFTRAVESVIDRVRSSTLVIDGPLVALLLLCRYHVAGLIEALIAGSPEPSPAATPFARSLASRLEGYLLPSKTEGSTLTLGVHAGNDAPPSAVLRNNTSWNGPDH